jgi:hypothetical protein
LVAVVVGMLLAWLVPTIVLFWPHIKEEQGE